MKFKIDENLPAEIAQILKKHGFDAMTVKEQELGGQPDTIIAAICQQENRALVTLDLDFSDPRKYTPERFSGIVILRPKFQTIAGIIRLTEQMIRYLAVEPLTGQLWIVEENRLRIREENP